MANRTLIASLIILATCSLVAQKDAGLAALPNSGCNLCKDVTEFREPSLSSPNIASFGSFSVPS